VSSTRSIGANVLRCVTSASNAAPADSSIGEGEGEASGSDRESRLGGRDEDDETDGAESVAGAGASALMMIVVVEAVLRRAVAGCVPVKVGCVLRYRPPPFPEKSRTVTFESQLSDGPEGST
jgi:hypothetical protein